MVLLAQVQPPAAPRPKTDVDAERVRIASSLTLASILVVLLLGALGLVLLRRYRKSVFGPGPGQTVRERRGARHRPDPWKEAARRIEPEPRPGSDDDTVDLDPPPGDDTPQEDR